VKLLLFAKWINIIAIAWNFTGGVIDILYHDWGLALACAIMVTLNSLALDYINRRIKREKNVVEL